MERLEKYYEDFRKHDLYYKMIRDLDLDTTSSLSEDSTDGKMISIWVHLHLISHNGGSTLLLFIRIHDKSFLALQTVS